MKASHLILSWVLAGLFAAIWIFVPVAFSLAGIGSILWHVSMSVLLITLMVDCVHVLRPDRMIVSVFLGDVYKVYAREKESSHGLLGTGIVWVFPPILNRAIYLPVPVFTIPFQSTSGNTKETSNEALTPVTAFLHLQLRFKPKLEGLRAFLEAIPVLREYRPDLTSIHRLRFYSTAPDGTVQWEEKDCPCIAGILLRELSSTVGEAVGRATPKFPLSQALADISLIETEIQKHFEKTVFDQAQLLKITKAEGENGEIITTVEEGNAVTLFDFNVSAIVPSDLETARSLSAKTREQYTARGSIARAVGQKEVRTLEGQGEAAYLAEVASQAKTPEGQLALAATTLRNLPANATIIATPNVLDAVAAKLVAPQNPQPPQAGVKDEK